LVQILFGEQKTKDEVLSNEFVKTSSGWKTIKKAVPQESVHSPLLFLLYNNDLPLGINTDSKLLL
jgi:hypothetical protein